MKRRFTLRSQNRRSYTQRLRARVKAKERAERQRRNIQSFRSTTVFATVFLAMSFLVLRLGYVQITKGSTFRSNENMTTVQRIPIAPARGRIYDANGELLAYDQPSYSVFLTRINKVNNTTRAENRMAALLAPVFHQKPAQVIQLLTAQQQYSTITLFKHITTAQLTFVTEHQNALPGVSVQVDSQRKYPYGDFAGQMLGYVAPITQSNVKYYLSKGYMETEQVGTSGLELQYEKLLHGKLGYQEEQYSLTTTGATHVGTVAPVAGDNLQLTLNGELEAQTQQLLMSTVQNYEKQQNVKIPEAAAVMINVKTGGILAMVSYPYMDPNWFVSGNNFNQHANYLMSSGAENDNVIQNPHQPGSTVKPGNLIIGLEHGVITPNYTFYDNSIYQQIGTYQMREDASYGIVGDIRAIAVSDDRFFYNVGLNLGKWLGSTSTNGGYPAGGNLQTWRDTDFIRGLTDIAKGELRYGLGAITGIDLPGEQAGGFYMENQVPNNNYTLTLSAKNIDTILTQLKNKGSYTNYGSPYDLAAIAFGQGQQFTPIELAQYVTTLADNGKRLQPHLLKAIYPPGLSQTLPNEKPISTVKTVVQANLKLNQTYVQLAQEGMYQAVHDPQGTAYNGFLGAHYAAAGKTGTAGIYLNGVKTNNSVFIGYAPFNNPQIAVAIMVPGAGFGATTAVPIGRAMMDDYFNEQHASFMPKKGWTSPGIPANWTKSSAYLLPEQAK